MKQIEIVQTIVLPNNSNYKLLQKKCLLSIQHTKTYFKGNTVATGHTFF